MYVNTPKDPMLSSNLELTGDYAKDKDIMSKWLNDSIRRTEEAIKEVYKDIVVGTVKHRVYTFPNLAAEGDLEEGQVCFNLLDGTTCKIYVKTSGTIFGTILKS